MKIVVGYDGSDPSKRALERAMTLAGDGGQIKVVAASELRVGIGFAEGTHLDPSREEHARSALEEARSILSERGIEAEFVDAHGDAGDVIVEQAKDADLVIVGTRGLNPLQRVLLGSVSSKVVHRAESDVLVVR